MKFVREQFGISERRACEVLGLPRSSCRYTPRRNEPDERRLVQLLHRFVVEHPRYGYRRFWARLQEEGIAISLKSTYRIWSRHHLR